MALAFFTIGAGMIVLAVRGNATAFYGMLTDDLKSGFVYWLFAILGIGLLGQVPQLRQFSTYMLALVLVVLILHDRNAITNFESTFKIGTPK